MAFYAGIFTGIFTGNKAVRLLWNGLLDFVYPPHCLICHAANAPVVCSACFAGFAPLPAPACTICGRPQSVQGGANPEMSDEEEIENAASRVVLPCHWCDEAQKTGGWGFDRAFAAGSYYGPLKEGVHQLKYNRREFLGEPLGEFLANRCVVENLIAPADLARIDYVAAVPLHSSRERGRGFNQARLLARPVAEMHGVPLLDARDLRRVRKTRPQVGLTGVERMANINAQVFWAGEAVKGKGVLLIDDVLTTGATVSACARALKDAGASPVFVVVLAAGA